MLEPKKILICGLPGSGKSTLAEALVKIVPDSVHLDGDAIREATGNWDFSPDGRYKQSVAMSNLADTFIKQGKTVIASYVAPTQALRDVFGADFTVWMDTIPAGAYQDTNSLWEDPIAPDVIYHEWIDSYRMASWVQDLVWSVPPEFDREKPTAIMIGRFQPWHSGHRALFEKALEKYGQVQILIRAMPESDKDPLSPGEVYDKIYADLLPNFYNRFDISVIPNTAAVVYGRDVGYVIDKIDLSPETEAISATAIRKAKGWPILIPDAGR